MSRIGNKTITIPAGVEITVGAAPASNPSVGA